MAATQAVKVKNEESQGNAITGAAAGVGEKITGTYHDVRDFLHESAVLLLDVVWSAAEARIMPRQRIAAPARLNADAVLRCSAGATLSIARETR